AANHWETLARRPHLTINRAGVVYAAVNAWEMDYKARHRRNSICSGLGLLQWYFTGQGPLEVELVDRYWQFAEVKQRDGLTCKLRTTRGKPVPVRVAQSTKLPPPKPLPREDAAPSVQGYTLAGALLTTVGIAGVAGMTGSLIGYAKRNQELKAIGEHGAEAESVYHQGKLLETWAIASGVTGGISLVTGVALLTVARHRKLTITPQLSGFVVRGKF
ncbi:MAG: hypothetical protein ACPG4T_13675, partial [Nannocystaceae bacterium]